MNIDDIIKICADFNTLIVDGQAICKNFDTKNKTCVLPEIQSCKYLDYIQDQEQKNDDKEKQDKKEVIEEKNEDKQLKEQEEVKEEVEENSESPVEILNQDEKIEQVNQLKQPEPKQDDKEEVKRSLPEYEYDFSYSRIQMFGTCPYKYYLKYYEKRKVEIVHPWLIIGKAFHEAIESVKKHGIENLAFDSTGNEYEDAKVVATVHGIYEKLYRDSEIEVEQTHILEAGGYKFIAVIDEYDVTNKQIIEHKTAKDVFNFGIKNVFYQFSLYKQVKPKTEKLIVNVIGKPALKPFSKGDKIIETPQEYYDRIREDIKGGPQKYYRKLEFDSSIIDTDKYFRQIMYAAEEIKMAESTGIWLRRPESCATFTCEYEKACLKNL